jgi:hypothetical protein
VWECRVLPKKTLGCNRYQRCFNKVLNNGLNMWIWYFNFVIFNNFAKTSKNVFLLCHDGVLCADWWGGGDNWIHFRISLSCIKMWKKSRGLNTFWMHCRTKSRWLVTNEKTQGDRRLWDVAFHLLYIYL